MRFLLGLISGAMAILLLAQIVNPPQDDWRQNIQGLAHEAKAAVQQFFSAGSSKRTPAPSELEASKEEPAPSQDLAASEEPALQPIPRPPDPLPLALSEDTQRIVTEVFEGPGPAAVQPGSHVVWVAFRSAMSASGFAERLSANLDHPFEVERRGPGRYEVVFDYRDEPQRREILNEAARVTGLPL
jgi:hypothetical protein